MATHRTDAPRDDLYRMTPAKGLTIRATDTDPDAGRLLVGYAAMYDQWTEINGWEGNFLERIATSAFKKTVAERSDQIRVLYDHGFDPTIGNKPLGKPRSIDTTDTEGLWTETPLTRTSYNDDILALLEDQAIDGMSFRFSVIRDSWDDEPDPSDHNPRGLPERTLDEVRLYEFGPVTFPAYEATTAGVRSREAYDAWRTTHGTGITILPHDPSNADRTVTLDESPATPPRSGHLTVARQARIDARLNRLEGLLNEPARTDPRSAP